MIVESQLLSGESIEDLGCNGMQILQAEKEYHFTSDAVILANLVKANARSLVADLGSGSGIIALLIAAKTKAKKITGIEIQEALAERSRRSVKLNGLEGRVEIVTADISNCADILGYGSQDIVVANPPYYRTGEGQMSENASIALCRHEIALTLNQLVTAAAKLVKYGGKFYVVFRSDRLSELLCCLSSSGLEPKRIINIQPVKGKAVDTVVVVAKKGAEKGVIVESYTRAELEYLLYGKTSISEKL